jgi:mono/diheme cytochrome c family protein
MTNTTDDAINTELFLPIILALLLVVVAAAGVWFSQIRPSSASVAIESTIVETESAAPAVAEVSSQTSSGDPAAGQELFAGTCAACHGPTGEGIAGLGKDMTTSEFIAGKTDDELVAFIKVGRDPSDPLNTTGVGMPARGGNPALTDEDLFDIVAYIRTLQQ